MKEQHLFYVNVPLHGFLMALCLNFFHSNFEKFSQNFLTVLPLTFGFADTTQ